VYLGGKQIAETDANGATQYVHTDALGSPVAHTNAAGAENNRTRFEPYGLTAAGTQPGVAMGGFATTGSALGFTGHVSDPETELVYMQQRYYDPMAGRFLSIDPVVTDANTGGSFNRYVYANNSPYKYIDPDGRSPDNAADRFVVDVLQWFGDRPNLVRGLEAAAVAANLGAPRAAGASAEAGIAGGVGAKAAAQLAKVAAPTEAQAKNIQRFTSKLPANAKDSVTVKPLPNGGVAAQGVSPGKVPGSSALYEKQIDSAGKTIQYTKTTTAPDGTIVHVKDKITANMVTP
jgi:RHS repeat-associated protein